MLLGRPPRQGARVAGAPPAQQTEPPLSVFAPLISASLRVKTQFGGLTCVSSFVIRLNASFIFNFWKFVYLILKFSSKNKASVSFEKPLGRDLPMREAPFCPRPA